MVDIKSQLVITTNYLIPIFSSLFKHDGYSDETIALPRTTAVFSGIKITEDPSKIARIVQSMNSKPA